MSLLEEISASLENKVDTPPLISLSFKRVVLGAHLTLKDSFTRSILKCGIWYEWFEINGEFEGRIEMDFVGLCDGVKFIINPSEDFESWLPEESATSWGQVLTFVKWEVENVRLMLVSNKIKHK